MTGKTFTVVRKLYQRVLAENELQALKCADEELAELQLEYDNAEIVDTVDAKKAKQTNQI